MVHVLVNLLGLAVLFKHTPEDTLAPHPHDGERKAGVVGTNALSDSGVAALSDGNLAKLNAGTGVHDGGFFDDISVLQLLLDGAAGVGEGHLVDLVGVDPDLPLSALEHRGSKALLQTKSNHNVLKGWAVGG